MPVFPAYIDLSDKKVLVVGGGQVALRKIRSLLKFTRNITVVAPRVVPELRSLVRKERLKLKRRTFMKGDLRDKDMVIVAVDDVNLQRSIFELCSRKGILCNSVDSPLYCNFIFPALIVRGELVIGISSSGRVPALSRRIRELVESCLPADLEEVEKRLAAERSGMGKGKERQRKMIELVEKLIPLRRFNDRGC